MSAALILIVIVLLVAAFIIAAAHLAHNTVIIGGAGNERFPKKIRDQPREHPEWGALDYNLFETAGTVSWYSSLLPGHVSDVDRALRAEFPNRPPSTIMDMTAHIGADSANFLKVFPTATVTAVELSPAVGAVLRRNAKRVTRALGVPAERFQVIIADSRTVVGTRASDLVYIDPPWEISPGTLQLSEMAGLVTSALQRGTRVVILKLPRTADPDMFDRATGLTATRYAIANHAVVRAAPSYHLLAYHA